MVWGEPSRRASLSSSPSANFVGIEKSLDEEVSRQDVYIHQVA